MPILISGLTHKDIGRDVVYTDYLERKKEYGTIVHFNSRWVVVFFVETGVCKQCSHNMLNFVVNREKDGTQ